MTYFNGAEGPAPSQFGRFSILGAKPPHRGCVDQDPFRTRWGQRVSSLIEFIFRGFALFVVS